MKTVIIALQASLTLLTMATPAIAEEAFKTSRLAEKATCTSILAGMANDARADPSVSVTYEGVTLLLVGNGKSYYAECKGGRISFTGSQKID